MTCKDCIHCEACERMISDTSKMFKVLLSEILKMNCDIKYDSTNILSGAEICQCFQDRSRFVEFPCKVGDTVYVIESIDGEEKIIQDHVETMGIGYYVDGINIYQWDGVKTDGYFEDFGKTVFITREEAEQALKERESNE